MSSEEFSRRKTAYGQKWLTYQNVLIQKEGEINMKSREQLTAGYNFQCFSYIQLKERFNRNKKTKLKNIKQNLKWNYIQIINM